MRILPRSPAEQSSWLGRAQARTCLAWSCLLFLAVANGAAALDGAAPVTNVAPDGVTVDASSAPGLQPGTRVSFQRQGAGPVGEGFVIEVRAGMARVGLSSAASVQPGDLAVPCPSPAGAACPKAAAADGSSPSTLRTISEGLQVLQHLVDLGNSSGLLKPRRGADGQQPAPADSASYPGAFVGGSSAYAGSGYPSSGAASPAALPGSSAGGGDAYGTAYPSGGTQAAAYPGTPGWAGSPSAPNDPYQASATTTSYPADSSYPAGSNGSYAGAGNGYPASADAYSPASAGASYPSAATTPDAKAPGAAPAGATNAAYPSASPPSPASIPRAAPPLPTQLAAVAAALAPSSARPGSPGAPRAVAAVRGIVRGDYGAPVANAQVLVAGKAAVTNAQGAFAISGVPLGRQAVLVRARGYADASAQIDLAAARGVDVALTLRRAAYGWPPR